MSAVPVRVTAVVAAARNGVIGRDGDLPWHLPGDLRFFKQTTAGAVVVAGRRTHESVVARLGRPLPGRLSVVVASAPPEPGGPVVHASSPEHGLELAESIAAWSGRDEVFVIGGAQLYAALLPHVERVWLTRVDADVEGDTRLPDGWLDGFALAETLPGATGEELPYAHLRYERR